MDQAVPLPLVCHGCAVSVVLRTLAERYGLTYVEDIMSYSPTGVPFYYFTDKYSLLTAPQKQRLEEWNAVVCGLRNPMAEDDFPKDMLTLNKPLYCYNFCNLIENRKEQAEDKKRNPDRDNPQEPDPQFKEFTAPEARVLIVDDNEINCMVAEEMLKPLLLQTDIASDGRQALEMIQKKAYDLILMDHLMPVMNGIEAVEALRKLDGAYYKKLPVIALTGNTGKDQREEYLRAGMDDYLSKPLDMAELYQKVRKWIPDKIRETAF